MTYQEDRALLKSKLLQYLNLFIDAIEDTEKVRDVERDGEFKAILHEIDDLSFGKFEKGSFRLTFTLYRLVFVKSSEIHRVTARDCQPIPIRNIRVTDSDLSRKAYS